MMMPLIFSAVICVSPSDGSGALQAAVNRGAGSEILLAPGRYVEKVIVPPACTNLRMIAECPGSSVIVWDDFASKKDADGREIGTSGSYTMRVAADGFRAEGLVIENSASDADVAKGGRGVGQAVALHVTGDYAVFSNCTIRSYQDTLYVANAAKRTHPSRQSFVGCRIEGSIDFIFGSAEAIFDDCDIVLRLPGVVTAASTPKEQPYGLVFRNCRVRSLAKEPSLLGRPWRDYAQTVFLDCDIGEGVAPEGWSTWLTNDGRERTAYYGDFGSTGPGAVGPRVAWAHTNATDRKNYLLKAGFVAQKQPWTKVAESYPAAFFVTDEARRVAQNVLDFQLSSGGWPKNVQMDDPLTDAERMAIKAQRNDILRGTIDNGATRTEIRFLARMYRATGEKAYLDGLVRGIEFLLYLQYPNGGWPQFDPKKGGYWSQITYNDGAMVGAMETLRNVFLGESPFDFVLPEELKLRCRTSFDKGVDCILKTQIVQNGKKTVWCQQHDKDTLAPCMGRSFELPALCTAESAGIVQLLMKLPRTPEIVEAVEGACAWWPKVAVKGYAVERGWVRPDGTRTNRLLLVDPETNPPMWARYYTIEDNRPFWGTRASERRFTFEEMLQGDNMSYQWWNRSGEKIARAYEKWSGKRR